MANQTLDVNRFANALINVYGGKTYRYHARVDNFYSGDYVQDLDECLKKICFSGNRVDMKLVDEVCQAFLSSKNEDEMYLVEVIHGMLNNASYAQQAKDLVLKLRECLRGGYEVGARVGDALRNLPKLDLGIANQNEIKLKLLKTFANIHHSSNISTEEYKQIEKAINTESSSKQNVANNIFMRAIKGRFSGK